MSPFRTGSLLMTSTAAIGALFLLAAEPSETFTDPEKAGRAYQVQGEYATAEGAAVPMGAQVIALGGDKYEAVLLAGGLPGAGWDGKTRIKLTGEGTESVTFKGEGAEGTISGSAFTGKTDAAFELTKVSRKSLTLGAEPPKGSIILFDGTSVEGWDNGKLDGELLGIGTRTKEKFSSYTLHLEFRTPFMPGARGQARGNSGMYLNDQYEVQVLDSFGLTGENNECGGIYTIAKPLVNMCLPPLSWQTYDVDFTAAKYDAAGKKSAPAVVTIRQNGVVIHDKLELPKNTPGGGVNDESQPGALFLQDHGNPVRFRNIWILPE